MSLSSEQFYAKAARFKEQILQMCILQQLFGMAVPWHITKSAFALPFRPSETRNRRQQDKRNARTALQSQQCRSGQGSSCNIADFERRLTLLAHLLYRAVLSSSSTVAVTEANVIICQLCQCHFAFVMLLHRCY